MCSCLRRGKRKSCGKSGINLTGQCYIGTLGASQPGRSPMKMTMWANLFSLKRKCGLRQNCTGPELKRKLQVWALKSWYHLVQVECGGEDQPQNAIFYCKPYLRFKRRNWDQLVVPREAVSRPKVSSGVWCPDVGSEFRRTTVNS